MEIFRRTILVCAAFYCMTQNIVTSSETVQSHGQLWVHHQQDRKVANVINLIDRNSKPNRSTILKTFEQLELDPIPKPRHSVKLHDDIVIECGAFGSPIPRIQWWRDNTPIEGKNQSQDSNQGDNDGLVLSKVVAKLHIQCIRPEDEGIYTCVLDNKNKKLNIETVVMIERDDQSGDMKPSCGMKLRGFYDAGKEPWSKAYVAVAETLHMQPVGSRAELKCRSGGVPTPQTQWRDPRGNLVSFGEKYQSNTDESLIIESLDWADMGEYSCIVENINGQDKITNFVYPLSPN